MTDHITETRARPPPAHAPAFPLQAFAFVDVACPVYAIDAGDHTIHAHNAAARARGLPPRGATCYAYTHHRERPCARDGHLCPLEEVQRTGEPVLVRHIHYDREGRARLCNEIGLPVLDAQGRVTRMLQVTWDLPEQVAVDWANGAVSPPDLGHDLTQRERQVLRLIAEGLGNTAIAGRLGVTVHAAKFHVGNVFRKLGVANRAQAAALAVRHGLVRLEARGNLAKEVGPI